MKYETLIRILFVLLAKKQVSANYLAERFGVSVRTVYRYVECLELAHIPVIRKNGRKGGFSLPDSFRLPADFFSEQELTALQTAANAIGNELDLPGLIDAREKLAAIKTRLPYEKNTLSVGKVVLCSGSWATGSAGGTREKLALIEKSLEENRKTKLCYHSRQGEFSTRTVRPYYLLFKQGIWYLYAFCELRQDFRLFRVGRIKWLTGTEETFTPDPVPPPTLDFDGLSAKKTEFLLRVEPASISAAEDYFGIENMEEHGNEVYFRGCMPDDDLLVSEILQLGEGVEVVSPPALIDRVKSAAEKIFLRYENKPE